MPRKICQELEENHCHPCNFGYLTDVKIQRWRRKKSIFTPTHIFPQIVFASQSSDILRRPHKVMSTLGDFLNILWSFQNIWSLKMAKSRKVNHPIFKTMFEICVSQLFLLHYISWWTLILFILIRWDLSAPFKTYFFINYVFFTIIIYFFIIREHQKLEILTCEIHPIFSRHI